MTSGGSKGVEEAAIDSCARLMTTPNEVMRLLHHRMPVILPTTEYDQWLDYSVQELEPLLAILRPYPGEDLIAYPVSTRVNNPANDSSRCVLPLNA